MRVVHPRARRLREVNESIESFRASFKRMSIPETEVKVTWDTEALWARLRMRLPSGAIVEQTERYDDTRHPTRDVRECLWSLARWLDERSRRVKRGQEIGVVFGVVEQKGGA